MSTGSAAFRASVDQHPCLPPSCVGCPPTATASAPSRTAR